MIRNLNLTTSLSEWSMHWLSSVCSRIIFSLFSLLGIQLMYLSILDWNPDRRRPGPGSSLRGQRRPVLWEYSWSSDSAHGQPPGPDHGLLSLPRQDRGRAHRLSHGHQTVRGHQLGKYCLFRMNVNELLSRPLETFFKSKVFYINSQSNLSWSSKPIHSQFPVMGLTIIEFLV